MKKLVAAALAALVTTSALTGCKNNKNDNTTDDPFATLPEQTTQSTLGSDSESTSSESASSESDSTSESTSSEKPVDPPVVNPDMKGFNVLTGQPTLNDISYTRPVAIVVDNVSTAYATQTGLDQADILYEALVAPGITRFLMVTADYKLLDKVSNIRSGRDYHMDMAAYHNAVLVCHGGSINTNYDFYTLAAERYGDRFGFIDTLHGEPYFYVDVYGNKYGTIESANRSDLSYNTVFKPSAMTDLLESSSSKFVAAGGTLSGQAKETLKFVDYGTKKDLSGASSATEVTLKFKCQGSSSEKNVSFTYDAASGKYLRSQGGSAHLDSQTGKQLAFTNVITLFTSVEAKGSGLEKDPAITLVETKTNGTKGFGYYFTDGRVIEIFWESDGDSLRLEETSGSELVLNTGNTYIGYLDYSYTAGGEFWK